MHHRLAEHPRADMGLHPWGNSRRAAGQLRLALLWQLGARLWKTTRGVCRGRTRDQGVQMWTARTSPRLGDARDGVCAWRRPGGATSSASYARALSLHESRTACVRDARGTGPGQDRRLRGPRGEPAPRTGLGHRHGTQRQNRRPGTGLPGSICSPDTCSSQHTAGWRDGRLVSVRRPRGQ